MILAEPNLIKCARALRTFHVNLFETKQHGNEPCRRVPVIFFPQKSLIPLYRRAYRAYSDDNGKKQRLGAMLFIATVVIYSNDRYSRIIETESKRINDERRQRKRERSSGRSTYAVKKVVNNRQAKRNSSRCLHGQRWSPDSYNKEPEEK